MSWDDTPGNFTAAPQSSPSSLPEGEATAFIPQGQGDLSGPLHKVLGQSPEYLFMEEMLGLRVVSPCLCPNQPEVSENHLLCGQRVPS